MHMKKTFLAAFMMLIPFAGQASSILPDGTPDGDYLTADILALEDGDAPITDGVSYEVTRSGNDFYAAIDIALRDFDISATNLAGVGNYIFDLYASAPVWVDASLAYSVDVPSGTNDISDQNLSYSIGGVYNTMLLDNPFTEMADNILFRQGDTARLSLLWNGGDIENVQFTLDAELAPVPLPATLPMALVAIGGLGMFSRRRRS